MKFKIGDKVLYNGCEYVVNGLNPYRFVATNDNNIKPTIDDLRDYMLEHFVDDNGHLDISGLDFSEFDGSVDISDMKVKGNLFQNRYNVQENLCQSGHKVQGDLYQSDHEVQGNLFQSEHEVKGDLSQSWHKVQGDLSQSWHNVKGNLYQTKHNVKGDYICENIKYGGNLYINEPQKLLKEITLEELTEMGYTLKG